ncbi:RING-H2 finger protein ATL70-like [Silene latifolia]|uniref:RING-H2 finger protein ATL70-like n=1 Tax=Silene latifolia TaxID=37657 RepID=UPI003D772058
MRRVDNSSNVVVNIGLDEATLNSFPKLMYSQARAHKLDGVEFGQGGSTCSICLGEYKESDFLRLLPDCGHLFHIKCVDPWLRLNPTCPMCRTSPIPSPLPTPLVQVAS